MVGLKVLSQSEGNFKTQLCHKDLHMPIYEFECKNCRHVFERVMKLDENCDHLSCPSCGAKKPQKLVSGFHTNAWSIFLDGMERKVSPHKFK
jgi:putative FmdB family regulatory protein